MMTIKAIIEKGEDGLYAVRSESKIGRSFLGGFGESVEEARKDFEVSMLEAIEDAEKENTLSFFYALLLMRKQEIQYMLEDLKNVMDEQERSKGEGN
jgi:predicted RNase H-like HicB family nuclease